MDLNEYKQWIKQNGNKEEAHADKVAELVIKHHSSYHYDYDCCLHPHKVIYFNKGRLEFDLLIHFSWTTSKYDYDRLIGIEFKETDTYRVVKQAVARRDLVDYMYIATKNVWLDERELIQLFFYGIGWIVWFDDGFAKLILPSRYYDGKYKHVLLDIIHNEVRKKVNELSSLEKWMDIVDFTEDE